MFTVSERKTRFQVTMSATIDGIDRADECMTAFLRRRQVPVDVFALRILLREALLNAVIHGSGKDPEKVVQLDLRVDSEGVVLAVEDAGDGFTWCERSPELDVLDGDGGRGLALMRIYSDRIEFNKAGNRVVLSKAFKAPVAHGTSA